MVMSGGGARFGEHEIGPCVAAGLRHQIAAQVVGLRNRRRKADAGERGRDA
jgi:hypothetical protein